MAICFKNEHRGFATIEQTIKKYRLGRVGGTIKKYRFRVGRGLALGAILHNELMVCEVAEGGGKNHNRSLCKDSFGVVLARGSALVF